jgi:branched-chain amino acid transport system permease protein
VSLFIQYVLDGLSVGSLYVVLALGFTLVFGVMGLMNVAHADYYTLGVFAFLGLVSGWHVPVALAAVAAVLCATLAGAVVYVLVLKRVDRRYPLAVFVSSLGVSYFIENLLAQMVNYQTVAVPALFPSSLVFVAGVPVETSEVTLVLVTAGAAWALATWLHRSTTGRLMRAVAENETLAKLSGINTTRISLITIILASALAGLGGLLVSNTTLAIDPFAADSVALTMFAVAVVAGIGSVTGAAVVGFSLGVVESVTSGYVGSQWQEVAGLGAMAIVLVARPQGLFGKLSRVG